MNAPVSRLLTVPGGGAPFLVTPYDGAPDSYSQARPWLHLYPAGSLHFDSTAPTLGDFDGPRRNLFAPIPGFGINVATLDVDDVNLVAVWTADPLDGPAFDAVAAPTVVAGLELVWEVDLATVDAVDFLSTATAVWNGVTVTRYKEAFADILETDGATGFRVKGKATSNYGTGFWDVPSGRIDLDDAVPDREFDDIIVIQVYATSAYAGDATGYKIKGLTVSAGVDPAGYSVDIVDVKIPPAGTHNVDAHRFIAGTMDYVSPPPGSSADVFEVTFFGKRGEAELRAGTWAGDWPDPHTLTFRGRGPLQPALAWGSAEGTTSYDDLFAFLMACNPISPGEEATVTFHGVRVFRAKSGYVP